MEKRIEHDENGELLQMLKEKSCGLKSIERTYRTPNYNVRYVDDYGQGDSYVEVSPRYNEDMKIADKLASKFDEDSCETPPLFYIDGCHCYWEEVLKIRKKKHGEQITKIHLFTYEQLEFLLSKEEHCKF